MTELNHSYVKQIQLLVFLVLLGSPSVLWCYCFVRDYPRGRFKKYFRIKKYQISFFCKSVQFSSTKVTWTKWWGLWENPPYLKLIDFWKNESNSSPNLKGLGDKWWITECLLEPWWISFLWVGNFTDALLQTRLCHFLNHAVRLPCNHIYKKESCRTGSPTSETIGISPPDELESLNTP